jgi:hypothetical protein
MALRRSWRHDLVMGPPTRSRSTVPDVQRGQLPVCWASSTAAASPTSVGTTSARPPPVSLIELALRAVGNLWQERYALVDGRRELGRFRGRSWGRTPVRISHPDDTALEPGLLLFVAFVVRGLGEYAMQ